jgi:hypothetical protein
MRRFALKTVVGTEFYPHAYRLDEIPTLRDKQNISSFT